jgi:hypothetical protein
LGLGGFDSNEEFNILNIPFMVRIFTFFAKIEPENRKNIFQQTICGAIGERRKIFKQVQIFAHSSPEFYYF